MSFDKMDYEKMIVFVHGKEMTLKECSDAYQVDYDLLLSEFMECGDINQSLNIAKKKSFYIDEIKNFIFKLPITSLDKIMVKPYVEKRSIEETKQDLIRYIYYSKDDTLELTKQDLIALLYDSDFSIKPIIDEDEKQPIEEIIELILDSKKQSIYLDKKNIMHIIELMSKYRLPSTTLSMLLESYLTDLDKSRDNIVDEEYKSDLEPMNALIDYYINYKLDKYVGDNHISDDESFHNKNIKGSR